MLMFIPEEIIVNISVNLFLSMIIEVATFGVLHLKCIFAGELRSVLVIFIQMPFFIGKGGSGPIREPTMQNYKHIITSMQFFNLYSYYYCCIFCSSCYDHHYHLAIAFIYFCGCNFCFIVVVVFFFFSCVCLRVAVFWRLCRS